MVPLEFLVWLNDARSSQGEKDYEPDRALDQFAHSANSIRLRSWMQDARVPSESVPAGSGSVCSANPPLGGANKELLRREDLVDHRCEVDPTKDENGKKNQWDTSANVT